ncbi:hypothetical protein GFU95_00620 [Apibacter sp. B3889]|uniref:T6SS effector amidase Tae4 family protein n=1 Tax=unclassified Apibacter TaxID=2630820 RepID=UPI001321F22E|nr:MULTISPECIES: T6SS effector amidase Tae4 family protein [unclassified Apibacter]MXO33516.1 hypothetical protein [Apibacter sp. B3883]MXO40873.1 hypothetical protein [Apibacter sp. B3889]MXP04042.1 hypothetical protein [Apibacter sp. B3887]MXP07147.1 hypothetical protein [Apibacter sp. B3935]
MANLIGQAGKCSSTPVQCNRPKWVDMETNYPKNGVDTDKLYIKIGGNFSKFNSIDEIKKSYLANSCAIRMSRGLNLSGFKLPSSNKGFGEKGGVMKGGDGYYYWLRVKELNNYLAQKFGKPEFDKTLAPVSIDNIDKKEIWKDSDEWVKIKEMKGIISFDVSGWGDASGHFTLWDGDKLFYASNDRGNLKNLIDCYFWMHYVDKNKNKIIQTNRIRIWELK